MSTFMDVMRQAESSSITNIINITTRVPSSKNKPRYQSSNLVRMVGERGVSMSI